jgi:membrane protease subunit HflC
MSQTYYNKIYYFVVPLAIALFLSASSVFTVHQRQIAVVFQFGEAVDTVLSPGLHLKMPFIQNVEFFDKRLLHAEAEAKELTASDGKRIIVDAFAKYLIVDPVKFYKTVRDYQGVGIRLNKILESSMRQVIGKVPLTALLTEKRGNIMLEIKNLVSQEAKTFGISITDVKILRADLPKENSDAIYARMQTAREKEAKQIRAEGLEEAARIISKADKESRILLAEAYMSAEILKGEGDASAAKIYNSAYSVDPEFYKFYKALQVYKEVLQKEDTSFVLSPKADFFKFLNIK